MFNFSANHLLLLSRMEYRTCAVLLMRDDSTHRVYRLHDFTKSQTPTPGQYYCVSGKVNSADKLYLVIESIKPDTKHGRCSTPPAHEVNRLVHCPYHHLDQNLQRRCDTRTFYARSMRCDSASLSRCFASSRVRGAIRLAYTPISVFDWKLCRQ